jgi:hypothetical protein
MAETQVAARFTRARPALAGRAQYFQLLEILMKEAAFINFSESR